MHIDWTLFALFNLFVVAMLALDLGVFHRRSHIVGTREALIWTAVWAGLALIFNAAIWLAPGWFFGPGDVQRAIASGDLATGAGLEALGHMRGEQFLAAWLIEKALAVDNLFVFLLIFSAFAVPAAYQHKVLFYGIIGALVMRAGFIFGGVALLERFHWVVYIFGAFLVWTGIRMAMPKTESDPRNHWAVRLLRRIMPVSETYDGDRLFTVRDGRRMATPLFLVLVLIEVTDLVFAVDSIPAVLAISNDVFIVYTSNVFAILGLRSLFFALSGMMGLFHYLSWGLSAILVFVGAKMLLMAVDVKVPIHTSLMVIGGILALAVIASLIRARRKPPTII